MAVVQIGYRPKLLNRGLSGALDCSRWIAALAVCCAHVRNLLFPDFVGGNAVTKLFYFLTLFGTQAVVVFFVASGLLVGGTIMRAIDRGNFDRTSYAIDRGSRLYVVLIPAIILTEALRMTGLTVTCPAKQNTSVILENFLFLQNFYGSPLCNNHPLWSLSSEAFFYVIGPAILLFIYKKSLWAAIFSIFLFIVTALFFSNSYMTPLFGLLLWFIGLAPWFVSIRMPAWLGVLPFVAFLLASRSHHTLNEFADALGLAITFSFFLCCRFRDQLMPLSRLSGLFAGFSYSLYLVHMPIAQAMTAKLGYQLLSPRSARSFLVYGVALAVIILVALVFGRLFEDNTKFVRNWLRTLATRWIGARSTRHFSEAS